MEIIPYFPYFKINHQIGESHAYDRISPIDFSVDCDIMTRASKRFSISPSSPKLKNTPKKRKINKRTQKNHRKQFAVISE